MFETKGKIVCTEFNQSEHSTKSIFQNYFWFDTKNHFEANLHITSNKNFNDATVALIVPHRGEIIKHNRMSNKIQRRTYNYFLNITIFL